MATPFEKLVAELKEQPNSYKRYRSALAYIADGCDQAQALAAAMLEPAFKEPPNYRWKREQEARKERAEAARQARREYCKALYEEWLEAGRPQIAKFARDKGKSRSSTENALKQHERRSKMPWEQKYLAQAELERSKKLRASRQRHYEETHKEHFIRVRYFDREESAEALAAELGWTMEQMQAFIEAARMDKWVTTTEYNLQWKKLLGKYGPAK